MLIIDSLLKFPPSCWATVPSTPVLGPLNRGRPFLSVIVSITDQPGAYAFAHN